MNSQLRSKLIYEFLWFIGLLIISTAIEYIVIVLFDLHPILNVKIQGIIGLIIIGYGIRVVARIIGEAETISEEDDNGEISQNSKRS